MEKAVLRIWAEIPGVSIYPLHSLFLQICVGWCPYVPAACHQSYLAQGSEQQQKGSLALEVTTSYADLIQKGKVGLSNKTREQRRIAGDSFIYSARGWIYCVIQELLQCL